MIGLVLAVIAFVYLVVDTIVTVRSWRRRRPR